MDRWITDPNVPNNPQREEEEMEKTSRIGKDVAEFLVLIKRYDENYGEIEVIETKRWFILTFYNGGWSDNESAEQEFIHGVGRKYLFYDWHPNHFFCINKTIPEYEDKHVFDPFRKLHCYKRKIAFNYKINIRS